MPLEAFCSLILKSFMYNCSDTNNTEELFDKIIGGNFEFNSPYWDDISEPAMELIALMLEVDPEKRLTAEQVLSHQWIIVSTSILQSRICVCHPELMVCVKRFVKCDNFPL